MNAGQQLDDDRLMIRYLLGTASEEEQQLLEERYFADDQYFEYLQAVEEELIDTYVNGQLPPEESKRFEQRFLASPERRQRVEFARALRHSVGPKRIEPAPRQDNQSLWGRWLNLWRIPQPIMQTAFAAGLVLFVLGGSWLVVQEQRLRDRLALTVAEQAALRSEVQEQRLRSQQLTGELEQERAERQRLSDSAKSAARVLASFILTPGTARSLEGSRPLLIRPGTDSVQLQLDLATDDYPIYRVVLQTADGDELWSQDGLRAQRASAGRAIVMTLPGTLLNPGDYLLTLRGVAANGTIEDAGNYVFRTIRR